MFGELTPTPDGQVFGITFRPSSNVQEGQTEPHVAVVLLDQSRQIRTVKSFPGPNYQALFADADDRWVTWVEASRQPSFEDWVLYVYDRRTAESHTVARAATDSAGHQIASPYVEPKTDNGLIVWSAADVRQPPGPHIDCFIAPAAGDQPPSLLAMDCISPVIGWPYVAFDHHVGEDAGGYVELTVMDLRTREHHIVGGIRNSKYYALAGTHIVYTTEGSKTIHLRDIQGDGDQTLMDASGKETSYLQFPALSDQLATWGGTEGALAYDRKQHLVVQLQGGTGSGMGSVYLRGRILLWSDYKTANATTRDNRVLRLLDIGAATSP